MARPTLWAHPKFLALSMRLGSRMAAVGALECVWRLGYESGASFVGSGGVVEYSCEWHGESGALVKALLETGFLDEVKGGFAIHDLLDHAPEYVHKRFRREAARRQCPVTDPPLTGQRPVTDPPLTHTPSPAPAPTPTPKEKRERVAGGATRAPKVPLNGVPSLDEWTAKGRETFPDWPEEDVRDAFTFAGSEGKLHARGWEAMLSRLHAAYVRREEGLAKTPSPRDREGASVLKTIRKAKESTSTPRQPEPRA